MKILIGSNGGLTGIYLARHIKEIDDVVLYGADCSEVCAGKFFVDKQFVLPPSTNENFIDALIALLNSENIDIYFPTHSKETKIVSKYEEVIRERTNVNFLVSPYDTFLKLENKCFATNLLLENGITAPRLIMNSDCRYPIFMKKNIGSGSMGSCVIENSTIYNAYKTTVEDVSFYEYVEGTEYTVDCIFDNAGKLLGYNQRIREKTIGGAVSVSVSDNSFNIRTWIERIASICVFRGCVNFQYILKDGIPYFIDINLRFPSGGLPVTVASGLDIPKMLIDILSGLNVSPQEFSPKKVRMYRYYKEMFEYI